MANKRFELTDGTIFESNEKGNYFYKSTGKMDKKGNPIMMRIPRHIFEQTFEEYIKQANDEAEQAEWDAEMEARKQEQEQKDRETEAEFNKKAEKKAVKRTRKSKDIAHESNGVTITAKQADFIKHLPDTSFWENGLDSALWCDVLADEIGGQFAGKPMAVGAMISTLREKGLVSVGKDLDRKGKPKFMVLTEVGKQVAKELGLN